MVPSVSAAEHIIRKTAFVPGIVMCSPVCEGRRYGVGAPAGRRTRGSVDFFVSDLAGDEEGIAESLRVRMGSDAAAVVAIMDDACMVAV